MKDSAARRSAGSEVANSRYGTNRRSHKELGNKLPSAGWRTCRQRPLTGRKRRRDKPGRPARATGLPVALRGGRFLPLADAGRFGHGAAAAAGTQSLGQRSDVRLRCDAGLSHVERHQPRQPPETRRRGAGQASGDNAPRQAEENADIRDRSSSSGDRAIPCFTSSPAESDDPVKRATAIIAHLAVVLGMVLIGYRHFDNTHTGIAAATLYLLLPYTANFTPRIDHVVPAALLVWAIQAYRRPVVAGIFVGLAAGLIWYPLFLLPLWCSFYWRRGLLRFSLAVLVVLGLVAASLAFMPSSLGSYTDSSARPSA